jgi:phospholipase C
VPQESGAVTSQFGAGAMPAGPASARPAFVLTVVTVVVLAGLFTWSGAHVLDSRPAPIPIDHILYVILENHAYDNYFGTYCTTLGPYCQSNATGLPADTCVPYSPTEPSLGCVRPWAYTAKNDTQKDLPHDWHSSLVALDNGRMDGFLPAENAGVAPLGHYDGTTAPIFWDMAEQYTLSDNFFSSSLSYSLPNHWHTVAAAAPAASFNHYIGIRNGGPYTSVAIDHEYLNQANRTESIEDLLLNSTVTWKYYDFPLGAYNQALSDTVGNLGSAFNYWNPQAAKFESYNQTFSPHFVVQQDFYTDARDGNLPELSWVIPFWNESDHPPNNTTFAQGWLASIVNALASSPDWSSSVMFVTWDDYGGFYDHVAPPVLPNGVPLSFREPLIVISPYARENYVSHWFGYFESVLHLMEWRFHLGCLGYLDCNAPLPLDLLDFNQTPRAPMLFPTSVGLAQYPMPLQPTGGRFDPSPYTPPIIYQDAAQGPDLD